MTNWTRFGLLKAMWEATEKGLIKWWNTHEPLNGGTVVLAGHSATTTFKLLIREQDDVTAAAVLVGTFDETPDGPGEDIVVFTSNNDVIEGFEDRSLRIGLGSKTAIAKLRKFCETRPDPLEQFSEDATAFRARITELRERAQAASA